MKCLKCGNNEIDFNFSEGKIFCNFCGFLMEDNIINPDISFDRKNSRKSSINGQFVKNSSQIFSKRFRFNEIILFNAKRKIIQISNSLKLKASEQDEAFRLFLFATQRGLIQKQILQNLCVSCLYTVCRQKKIPHLLIDFADITQLQIKKIGAVFLKFTRFLNLKIPTVDPSLFVHRFISRLQFGSKTNNIALSSLRLIARMKREWMSTGRRPGGLCGAAILLAARMHGINKTQKEITEIVRIGDIALRSRLREIDKTSMAKLTICEVDRGGGDDGNGNTLFEINNGNAQNPPSFFTRSKKKKFSLILNSGKKSVESIYKGLKSLKNNLLKVIYKKRNTKFKDKKKKVLEKHKIFCAGIDSLFYINSAYEIFMKENIWKEVNENYLSTQSIVARAQKEKPFGYFRTNILKKNQV